MKRLRTTSSPRLLAIVAVLVAVVAGAGIAQASLNDTAKPAPKPLDRAILDAANAPPVDGVTARIDFTNNLLPSGSLPENTASPTLTGAEGRLWLANDGRLRLELQSSNGDAQIVADGKRFMLYDAASKTAFTGALPESKERKSRPQAGDARRRPSGTRQARRAVDAVRRDADQHRQPAELHGADRAQGRRRPARRGRAGLGRRPRRAAARRRLRAGRRRTRCSSSRRPRSTTAPIAAAMIDATPPKGAKVTELNPPTGVDAQGQPTHVTGLENVQTAAGLPARRARRAGRPAPPRRQPDPRRRARGRAAALRRRPRARSSSSSAAPSPGKKGRSAASRSRRSTSTAPPARSSPPRSARS